MTRIDKLYARLLANPRATISFRDFEKLLKRSASSTCERPEVTGNTFMPN